MIPYIHINIPPIFGLRIEAFGILVCLGCIVGMHFAKKRAVEKHLDPRAIDDIAIWCCIVAGFAGAHLFHYLAYEPETFFKNPMIYFTHFRSGLSSFGGFFTAALAIAIYLWRRKLSYLKYGEAILFGLLPGWILGRMGCTTAHDHPGKFTDFFLGVKYPEGVRHDLGFYELIFTIVLTAVVYRLDKLNKNRPNGYYLSLSFISYGIVRFFLDYLRVDDVRYAGLTPAQFACIGLTLYGTFLAVQISSKPA
jgi:phosphatidylglycerol:prolipoprotein diacylglycerol transferase